MNVGRILRAVLLGVVLSGGSILGVPMRPEEIEELMSCMNKPNVEVTVDEKEFGERSDAANPRANAVISVARMRGMQHGS